MEHFENDVKGRSSIFTKRKRNSTEEEEGNNLTTLENLSNKLKEYNLTNENSSNGKAFSRQESILKKNLMPKTKKKRKSKNDGTYRDFICNTCGKTYLSYPALYTHKRNKHNIIPITGKPEIFKASGNASQNKFKYNLLENSANLAGIIESIIDEFLKISQRIYEDPESNFHKPGYDPESDSFIKLLRKYQSSNKEKIEIPKEKENMIIDHILVVYLILLIEVTRDDFFVQIIIYFAFQLREFLNLTGWDYITSLKEYGLYDSIHIHGEFCQRINCEELPELVNDFLLVFLEIDDHISCPYSKKDLADMTQNFCYWLYINGLTNYKLTKSDS